MRVRFARARTFKSANRTRSSLGQSGSVLQKPVEEREPVSSWQRRTSDVRGFRTFGHPRKLRQKSRAVSMIFTYAVNPTYPRRLGSLKTITEVRGNTARKFDRFFHPFSSCPHSQSVDSVTSRRRRFFKRQFPLSSATAFVRVAGDVIARRGLIVD